MVKNTVFDHFVGLALKGLKMSNMSVFLFYDSIDYFFIYIRPLARKTLKFDKIT